MKCPTCFEGTLETKKGDYLEGKYLIHDGTWEECPNCGEKLFGPAMMNKLQDAYYYNNNLIFPVDIKQQRESCGKTQQELADAINVSANSIKRWEKGSYIQPENKDKPMREIFAQWENKNLSAKSIKHWIHTLMDKNYSAPLAFATNTEGNVCKEKEKDLNEIIKKIK